MDTRDFPAGSFSQCAVPHDSHCIQCLVDYVRLYVAKDTSSSAQAYTAHMVSTKTITWIQSPMYLFNQTVGSLIHSAVDLQSKSLTPDFSTRARSLPTADPMDFSLHQGSNPRTQAWPRQNAAKKRRSKPGNLTTTHELRMMRTLVTSMESELHNLQSKWTAQIPDARTRVTARWCASEKYATSQSYKARRELQEVQQEQRFLLASLQTAVLRSPLRSNGEKILQQLHFGTQLGREPEERERVLMEHNRRALATVPSIVEKFSRKAIDKALAKQKEAGKTDKPVMPLSQVEITGCKDCTLVTSVFVSEIPHPSLEKVYEAATVFFNQIPAWMKYHFGINATQKRLNSAESPAEYSRLNADGGAAGLPVTANIVVCSELTPRCGVISMDAITEDPLYPVPTANLLQYGICALTVTPVRDPSTGNTTSVMLRWVVLYRYNLLPGDSALKADLELHRPILNGDLITSAICSYLQDP